MATAKKVETPVKRTVKASGVRIRSKEDAQGFFSKRGTQPLNDVYDREKGEVIEGLTEEEKIAAGYRQPYVKVPSFKKNPYARQKWKEVHTNAKGPTAGYRAPRHEHKYPLVVHFINKKKVDPFQSTKSFKDVAPSELLRVLKTTLSLTDDSNPLMLISKYYFKGKRFIVTDGKAEQK